MSSTIAGLAVPPPPFYRLPLFSVSLFMVSPLPAWLAVMPLVVPLSSSSLWSPLPSNYPSHDGSPWIKDLEQLDYRGAPSGEGRDMHTERGRNREHYACQYTSYYMPRVSERDPRDMVRERESARSEKGGEKESDRHRETARQTQSDRHRENTT